MVPYWIHVAATEHPERVALANGSESLTYAQLRERARDGARRLAGQGVAPGQRVALEIEDRLEFAAAVHACLLIGSAVPVDLRLSAEERAARRAGAALVLRDGELGSFEPGILFPTTLSGDAVKTVMHTSGTTAAPKPVELTVANWQANAAGSATALGLDPAERWLCVMPLTHVGGLSILIRSVIYATTVVLHDRFETAAVLRSLSDPDERITIVSLVPTMLARLLDAGLRNPPTLRWALLGGGPIAPSLLDRAAEAGVPVAPTYGMTEACSQIATFGRPLPGVELRLADDGELLVAGPIVAPGAVGRDGWLRTGDLAQFDDEDRLRIVGRKADTIVTGGENVAPAEVEAALLEHPAVADAGVFARPDEEWGEAVIAAVVLRNGAPATPDDLGAHCAERLARFKIPKAFEFRDSLPRTDSGKLLRRELA
jgi:O-succinylbenzoic acid--CoA ligase